MLYMLAGAERMKEVSDGTIDLDDIRTCIDQLVAITLAGLGADFELASNADRLRRLS